MAKRRLEDLERFAIDVILHGRGGKRAALLRALLLLLSQLFTAIVRLRVHLYRTGHFKSSFPGCTVISIGNLTVGGTGKTPVVELFARTLQDNGRRVAILSRGYKSRKPPVLRRWQNRWRNVSPTLSRIVHDGKNLLLDSGLAGDEPYMLAKSLGNVVVLTDRDRRRAAATAVEHFKADTLLLDDGMQYLPLGRRIEVCLVDAQAPFGNGFLLPRGTLREPVQHIRRADYIFLTKCDAAGNHDLIQTIRKHNPFADIIECTHAPLHLVNLHTGEQLPLEWLKGKLVGALSGIARPESFEEKLEQLGATIDIRERFADHHRFSEQEIQRFSERCTNRGLHALLTTEKDAVRFPESHTRNAVPTLYLRVHIEILSGHHAWEQLVQSLTHPPELSLPEPVFA